MAPVAPWPGRALTTLMLLPWLAAAVAGEVISRSHVLHHELGPGEEFEGIRLRGAVELEAVDLDGVGVAGLSALAWDADEDLLYALSDRGRIFHLRPHMADGMLKAVEGLRGFHLRNANGRYIPRRHADSEGMVALNADNGVRGDTRLVIGFEQTPRLMVFRPDGHWAASYALPTPLRLVDNYNHPNRALEAVAFVAGVGPLTGPERPFWNEAGEGLRLYDLEGNHWRYPLSPDTDASLVAMEYLPERDLLTLERSFVSPFHPLRIRLRRAELPDHADGTTLAVEEVALLDSHRGWNIDNFEGLAHHRDNRWFMVSDDNERGLQKTLLVYFELLARPDQVPHVAADNPPQERR
ncbi:MAG: esterase-like activity of phytase family protein [Gammaproteobacteria bacterium]|nr:esterase-like activity of phytase family protein [Gammaproteobacteria bacterium]